MTAKRQRRVVVVFDSEDESLSALEQLEQGGDTTSEIIRQAVLVMARRAASAVDDGDPS